MTVATIDKAPPAVPGRLPRGRGGGGPATKRTVVAYGFWIFILSDMVMFSALFAAFAVLRGQYRWRADRMPSCSTSATSLSIRCACCSRVIQPGSGRYRPSAGNSSRFLIFAVLTFVLGAAFLFIEVTEFAGMVAKGAGPSRSAFLSAFFTLVGTHGIHVAGGLIALIYLAAQVIALGLRPAVLRRLLCWSLFWHALDIVWVGVFTLVYLMGDWH